MLKRSVLGLHTHSSKLHPLHQCAQDYAHAHVFRVQVRRLVAERRLQFANGGWVQHDEAGSHYVGMLDQTARGHAFLLREFNATPTIAWQIDPFGHSATQVRASVPAYWQIAASWQSAVCASGGLLADCSLPNHRFWRSDTLSVNREDVALRHIATWHTA
jgi:Glycosyl hydrolases family 38 N-terminal domain